MANARVNLIFISWSTFVFRVLSCDLPYSERFECGCDITTREECRALNCCYDDSASSTAPKCYFRRKEAAGSTIQTSNGLCVYPLNGSTADNTSLVWSSNCSSRDAMFLVSHGYPAFHITSGRCILPANGRPSDPGIGGKLALGTKTCKEKFVSFGTADNGNLEYYYIDHSQKVCIGEGFGSFRPKEGDPVTLSERACKNDPSCQHLTYAYQKRVNKGKKGTISCPGSSSIQITETFYDPPLKKYSQHCFQPEGAKCISNTTTDFMRNKCCRKSTCQFEVDDDILLLDSNECSFSSAENLAIRYFCAWKEKSLVRNDKNISFRRFQINLAELGENDKFVQIIVKKLPGGQLPATHPDSYPQSHLKSHDSTLPDTTPYIAAELSRDYTDNHAQFTVGDGERYDRTVTRRRRREVGFLNVELEPGAYYSVFQRTFQDDGSCYNSEWMAVVRTKSEDIEIVPKHPTQKTDQSSGNPLDSFPTVIYIVVIVVQLMINIILGCFVRRFWRKKCSQSETKKERNGRRIDVCTRAHVVKSSLHEYECPNDATNYEELRARCPEERNNYQSLQT